MPQFMSMLVRRKLAGGLAENGKDYKWVSYRDYTYGYETCEPVKYDQKLTYIPCFLRQARIQTCAEGWDKRDILGFCNDDKGESWATFCNKEFKLSTTFTMTNADVLCMTTVAQRELIITRVDVLTASNVKTKPWMVLTGIHGVFLVNITHLLTVTVTGTDSLV